MQKRLIESCVCVQEMREEEREKERNEDSICLIFRSMCSSLLKSRVSISNLLLLTGVTFLSFFPSCSQAPGIQWQLYLGGSSGETLSSIHQTKNGAYLLAGSTRSYDGDISLNHGFIDYWLVKLNQDGTILWEKTYGGSYFDECQSLDLTPDGGCIMNGITYCFDGPVKGFHGWADWWVVKVDSLGHLEWQKALGGKSFDGGKCVTLTLDGGYIITGNSSSHDGDLAWKKKDILQWNAADSASIHNLNLTKDINRFSNAWIIKLDHAGQIEWQRLIGGNKEEGAQQVVPTKDGGFIVNLSTKSTEGEIHAEFGKVDVCILKLDSLGQTVWQRVLGWPGWDAINTITITKDNGYALCGSTTGNDTAIISAQHNFNDMWVCKLDSNGLVEWNRTYGGSFCDEANCIMETRQGDFLIGGSTNSLSGTITTRNGKTDGILIKLDKRGNLIGQMKFGRPGNDIINSMEPASDGGLIMAGVSTERVEGDLQMSNDIWVIKLKPFNQ